MRTVQSRKRQESRLRLRSWLKRQIESGKFDGLKWIDREKQMFRVPWKHASRHSWSLDKDACLFRDWAMYTGKYKEGFDKPDPKRWKTNFRCALNALPDIEHVKQEDSTQSQDSYRVYVMAPKDKKQKKNEQRHQRKTRAESPVDIEVLTPPPSESETESLSDQEVPSEEEIIDIVDELSEEAESNETHLFHSISTINDDLLPLGLLQQLSTPGDWYYHFETDKVRVERSFI